VFSAQLLRPPTQTPNPAVWTSPEKQVQNS